MLHTHCSIGREKDLVVVFGPPAVGKLTVARALSERLHFRLFHNHMSNEVAASVFGYESPQYHRVVRGIRKLVFDEFLASSAQGLVFTFVWHLDQNYGLNYFNALRRRGYRITLVELKAPLETLLSRNKDAERVKFKPSKRDIDLAEQNLLTSVSAHELNTGCTNHPIIRAFPRHMCFDTVITAPDAVASVVERTLFPGTA